jgi:hypothetical protein
MVQVASQADGTQMAAVPTNCAVSCVVQGGSATCEQSGMGCPIGGQVPLL